VLEKGTPFRERITWFLIFLSTSHAEAEANANADALTTHEISLWSALTASESQAYLNEDIVKDLLYKLWLRIAVNF
jgi:hypothetical protein